MPLPPFIDFLFKRLAQAWERILFWYQIFNPVRASLLIVILTGFVFLGVDQGVDTLLRLGSLQDSYSDNGMDVPRIRAMFAALFVLGLSTWGWARFLLNCDFPDVPKSNGDQKLERVRRIAGRTLGIGPPLLMAIAFAVLWWRTPGAKEQHLASTRYGWFSFGCIAICVLLFLFFEAWRLRAKKKGRLRHRVVELSDIRKDWGTQLAIALSFGVTSAAFVGFTIWPVQVGQAFGSPAILLLAFSGWVGIGSLLVYFGSRYRVPVISAALLLAALFSYSNDNHAVRTLPKESHEPANENIAESLDRWFDHVSERYPVPPGTSRPMFLVAAAGGGIRAAYWPATILSRVEDLSLERNRVDFAEHTFAISGVSGGALGAVTFDALVAGGSTNVEYRLRAQWLLDDDFLAADLAKFGFADLLQRFLPVPIPAWDRGRSLEDAWAAAWDDSEQRAQGNPLDGSIEETFDLAKARNTWLPSLLLNGTSPETGKRIITSNLKITSRSWMKDGHDGEFIDVISAADKLENHPIRLSTAAHQSARFTYFSPAGRFKDKTRIVDGGYFENSGATTLLDVLEVIRSHISQRKAQPRSGKQHETEWQHVRPVLILIDNDPMALASSEAPGGSAKRTSTGTERAPRYRRFLPELLSPLDALLETRNARGSFAFAKAQDFKMSNADPARGRNLFEFHLYNRHIELPLGWVLSGNAIGEMNDQLLNPIHSCLDPKCTDCPRREKTEVPLVNNPSQCEEIVALLPARSTP